MKESQLLQCTNHNRKLQFMILFKFPEILIMKISNLIPESYTTNCYFKSCQMISLIRVGTVPHIDYGFSTQIMYSGPRVHMAILYWLTPDDYIQESGVSSLKCVKLQNHFDKQS